MCYSYFFPSANFSRFFFPGDLSRDGCDDYNRLAIYVQQVSGLKGKGE